MVQNILVLWFVNQLFDLIWNVYYVDYVQIIMVEDIGLGGCVGYYDGIGVVCDVIQNYFMQLLVLIVMEELVSFYLVVLQVEKIKVFLVICFVELFDQIISCGQYVVGW